MKRDNPLAKLTLTGWGGIVIFSALLTGVILQVVMPPSNRSAMLGQGLAQILMLLIGMGMVATGLIRGRR